MIPAETRSVLEQIAQEFERQEQDCADTAARIEKRNETKMLGDESATAAHYRRNQEHFGLRGRTVREALALLADSGRPPEPQCTPEEFAAQQREREANGALFDAGFRAGLTFTSPLEPRAGGQESDGVDEMDAKFMKTLRAGAGSPAAEAWTNEPWAPIDTAPKDGRKLMLFQAKYGPVVGRWLYDSAAPPCWWVTNGGWRCEPTHWMPLPSSPLSPAAAPTKEPSMEWQPIETAPKDGTRVLAFLGDTFHVCVLSWDWDDHSDREAWVDAEEFATDPQPTHWMPLPDPPLSPAAERKTKE